MPDTLHYALRDLRRRPARTGGIILGYTLVLAAWTLFQSGLRATRDATTATLWDIGAHTMAFAPLCCDASPAANAFAVNNQPARLFPETLVEQIRQSPSVADATPYLMLTLRASLGSGSWVIGGFDTSRPKAFSATVVAPSQLVAGRFATPDQKNALMAEKVFAAAHGLSVGSPIRLGQTSYTVSAIVDPPLRPGKANLYMDIRDLRLLASAQTAKDLSGKANAVLVESKSALHHKTALSDIRRILGDDTQITSYGCSVPGTKAMRLQTRTARLLTLFVALAACLLIFRAQCAAAAERRREIAILKAVGWRTRDLLRQSVAAALIQSVAGGILGCAAGATAARLTPPIWFTGLADTPPLTVTATTLAATLGLALLVGLLAGLLPASLAARVRPADILRQP